MARLRPGWLVTLCAAILAVSVWLPWLTTSALGGGRANAIGGTVGSLVLPRGFGAGQLIALLTSTLRMRPDRLVVGEVRGAEAMTFLEAINTGHGGSMTTLHAETPQLAVARLAIMALKSELPMTYQDMLAYIQGSIDVIVQVGRENGERGITEFYLPTPITEGEAR